MVVSPLGTIMGGASGSGWMHGFDMFVFIFLHEFSHTVKNSHILSNYVQPTIQSWTKCCNFFSAIHPTPHPRFNDEAKPDGDAIIEPGVRGFIFEPGVRGCGKNPKTE